MINFIRVWKVLKYCIFYSADSLRLSEVIAEVTVSETFPRFGRNRNWAKTGLPFDRTEVDECTTRYVLLSNDVYRSSKGILELQTVRIECLLLVILATFMICPTATRILEPKPTCFLINDIYPIGKSIQFLELTSVLVL